MERHNQVNKSLFTHYYKEELSKWWKESVKPDSNNRCIVAIARKAPRLFDILERETNLLSEKDFENIITEHALPFHFSGEDCYKDYILCDDSILYGSTYSKINDFIRTLQRKCSSVEKDNNIIHSPFAFNEELRTQREIIQAINEEKNYSLSLGNGQNLISTFINREMAAILREGPYDIEFPTITWESEREIDPEQIEEELNQFVAGIITEGKSSIYSNIYDTILFRDDDEEFPIKHKCFAWTVLIYPMNERNHRATEPEFCKLRFFLNPERTKLKIVAYSPYPVTTDMINQFASFLPDNQFKDLYVSPYECVKKKGLLNLSSEDNDASEQYVQYQTERSLVIWINYLFSLNLLSKEGEKLDSLREKLGCKNLGIKKKDIRYLLGSSLADRLYPLICEWIDRKQTIDNFVCDYSWVYSNNFREAVIPENYAFDFNNELKRQYNLCVSVKEFVSHHFYLQHLYLDEKSRIQSTDKFKRLRFGISYRGLYHDLDLYKGIIFANECKIFTNDNETSLKERENTENGTQWYLRNNLIKALHQTMDQHIDKGSVVPKYIKLDHGHKPVWTRMFRSGERIPPLIET
ncbi:MAG: hypothetical protein LBC48_00240, partial [Dysgonamonadaceae bacterium]|nr:hypothetical protein [Dysgonamonadaceae bacterium]